MKERPILFSGPMVNAILDNRKTQTRRPIKWPVFGPTIGTARIQRIFIPEDIEKHREAIVSRCPYGQPGDRLWVREAWADCKCGDFYFRADSFHGPDEKPYCPGCDKNLDRWRPSILMPRWASRITLEITAVRAERLQNISAKDAVAEGVIIEGSGMMDACDIASQAKDKYRDLWDSINAKRGFSWDSNPFVWVIEFKRINEARP